MKRHCSGLIFSMAYMKAWTTKEEVLKDLAEASGSKTRKKDLDDGYLVVGDAPPPVIPEDEDAEMKLMFGDEVSRKCMPIEEHIKPDLAGIQQMLQMMKDFNSGDDDENVDDGAVNTDNSFIAISKVSKLNPYVEEFKPRGVTPSRQLVNPHNNPNFVKQTVEKSEESKKETEVQIKGKESGDNNDLEVELNVDEKEYEDMATTLKNQISDAAKSDSFEFKKQKNVAIATLLKLYAKNTSPKKSTAPVKLFTPEYFEGKVESLAEVKIDIPIEKISAESSSTPEPRDSSTTLPSCSTFSTSSSNLTSPKQRLDPEIKKSIDKVNKWLEEPTKIRKSPAVCLGPVSFKRKERVSSMSPASDSSPKAHKPAAASQQYQPSQYAAELGQKYEQRNKVLESKQKEVTWTNLEEVLKAKDEDIRRRKEQEQASTSGS
ncbi:hypothetical protein PYW08_016814 [Mythimna loreyi]|uniref:Uncharacterized protein n=1 Tax=Mythimna loreyi TaxID=667449 RepID=A0ACC2QY16_9NEOP|nr:hypothetical protein PYW08_016814 [Mythimna loreyi]